MTDMPDSAAGETPGWYIYRGTRSVHDGIRKLPPPPPWRRFPADEPPGDPGSYRVASPPAEESPRHEAKTYLPSDDTVRHVNAALYLRRPLLVTGDPGTGKSTLADAVAYELGLGRVLRWPITSRSTLRQGLYEYDPLSRLYMASRKNGASAGNGAEAEAGPGAEAGPAAPGDDIGDYIRIGPLGTALLPYERPRVLLIDEVYNSDIDLPNDLLTVFETGTFEIPELARRKSKTATVMTDDRGADPVTIKNGTVTCEAFPLVIMTSNGEREFPPAFLRRCVSLELEPPNREDLAAIVRQHLWEELGEAGMPDGEASEVGSLPQPAQDILKQFLSLREGGLLANDQLLNAVYLCHRAKLNDPAVKVPELASMVMEYLTTPAGRR